MFFKLDDVEKLTTDEQDDLYKKHFNGALYSLFKLANLDVRFVRATGNCLWDLEGNKYIDFTAGFGALNLGHNPERVINALVRNYTKPNITEQSINIYNGILACNISHMTDGELPICHFTSTGAETVEEAIKLAQMYKKSGVIAYCSNAYHGKTLGAISALGDSSRKNYRVFNKAFAEIPYGDFEALLELRRRRKITAFLVEPIQAEGGVIVPEVDYFVKVRDFCDAEDIVLILDEIQTGLGRCGSMFYYEQLGMVPDILCLAKSLSGGIMPVGCITVRERLWNATYGKLKNATLPSSTFGGNTFSCIAAIETLTVLREEKLWERAEKLGDYAIKGLRDMAKRHSMITDIRGRGLLIGIEFGGLKKFPGKMIIEFMMTSIISRMLREFNIVCGFSINNPSVLKFEPALIITKDEIDYFIQSLDQILKDEKGILSMALQSLKNAVKGVLS